MKTLTEVLLPRAAEMNTAFEDGYYHGSIPWRSWANTDWHSARADWIMFREERGFDARWAPLLTPPFANLKLAKGKRPSYGLTLQHHVQRVSERLIVNACPHAGQCVKVCVLNNGHGLEPRVVRARQAKTAWLVRNPRGFAYLLGWELAQAVAKVGPILFRPNVNSDVRWDLLIPSLFDPNVTPDVTSYGYTKDPFVLDTDGWVTPSYRMAYSWNETCEGHGFYRTAVEFLDRGGSIAMVTSRQKGGPLIWRPFGSWLDVKVVDADLTDEWMFEEGVIGDLSAKGKARKLIGKSGFVVDAGERRVA